MTAANTYVVNHTAIVVSTAITIIQIKAGAARPLEIIRAWVAQSSSTTSAQQRIQLLRATAAATVTSFTPLLYNPNDGTANAAGGTAATGITATNENSGDGDILIGDVFNVITGWLYLPTPEERPFVGVSGIIKLKFPAAPTSATFTAGIVFREL